MVLKGGMKPVDPFKEKVTVLHELDTMTLLLLSPHFRRLPLDQQLSYLSDLKTENVSDKQLAELMEVMNQRFASNSIANQPSELDVLPYNAFEALVKQGEIRGRDLMFLCETSEVINGHCNRNLQELRTGKLLRQYLFRTLLESEYGIDYGEGDFLATASYRNDDAKYLVQAMLNATGVNASTMNPRDCYDLFNDAFAWILVFQYLIQHYDRRVFYEIIEPYDKPVLKYLIPNLDPQLVCRYLISNKFVERNTINTWSNMDGYFKVLVGNSRDGSFIVDVFHEISRENLRLSNEDPLAQHILVEGMEKINLLIARFENIKRVLPGIPQKPSDVDTYVDGKNSRLGLPRFYGNTILLDIGTGLYIFIQGGTIKVFLVHPGETVLEYYSTMGNSGTPHAYALTKNYLYGVTEEFWITRDMIPPGLELSDDLIRFYWQTLMPMNPTAMFELSLEYLYYKPNDMVNGFVNFGILNRMNFPGV